MLDSTLWTVGVDEVGRGPLAGPVVVCALMWRNDAPTQARVQSSFPVIKDSKKLSPKQRDVWCTTIKLLAEEGIIQYSLSFRDANFIDTHGINKAIQCAVCDVLRDIVQDKEEITILLDGGLRAPNVYTHQKTIVRGDATELPIALASIVAKVARDTYMVEEEKHFPQYTFSHHKGYGTRQHITEIQKHGLSLLHRKTFCSGFLF